MLTADKLQRLAAYAVPLRPLMPVGRLDAGSKRGGTPTHNQTHRHPNPPRSSRPHPPILSGKGGDGAMRGCQTPPGPRTRPHQPFPSIRREAPATPRAKLCATGGAEVCPCPGQVAGFTTATSGQPESPVRAPQGAPARLPALLPSSSSRPEAVQYGFVPWKDALVVTAQVWEEIRRQLHSGSASSEEWPRCQGRAQSASSWTSGSRSAGCCCRNMPTGGWPKAPSRSLRSGGLMNDPRFG